MLRVILAIQASQNYWFDKEDIAMEFSEQDNKIVIIPERQDEKNIEIEDLRRQKERNDALEQKLAAIMAQLGMTE